MARQRLLPKFGLKVYPFRAWCQKNGMSVKTGRRLVKAGLGPKLTDLTERIKGVREDHDAEWLESRVRNAS